MNNFEHICEGGIDMLTKWHLEFDPAYICERNRSGEIGSCECCDIATGPDCPNEHLRKWLEYEYVEPDTLERIIEDVEAIAPKSVVRTARWATEYCKRIGKIGIENDCEKCKEANCQIFAHGDIAARLRKVAENG